MNAAPHPTLHRQPRPGARGRFLRHVFGALAACSLASIAPAATEPFGGANDVPERILDGALEFQFTPGVWIPRLGGDSKFGPAAEALGLDLGADLRLNDREPTFLPELTIRKRDTWEMHFGGFEFSASAAGEVATGGSFGSLNFLPGESFRTDFDLTSAAAEVRISPQWMRVIGWERADNRTAEGELKVDMRFMPIVGLRAVKIDHRVQHASGAIERTGGTWVAPYGGLRMELSWRPDGALPFVHLLRLGADGAGGPAIGGDGGFMWQVRAGLTCQFTENFGILFGYRLLELDVENDAYELIGGLQGLYIAGSIRF